MVNSRKNILFAHSGGVTSVVNTVAASIYQCAKKDGRDMHIARYGINGLFDLDFLLASDIADQEWDKIIYTPGSSFGSSRRRLPKDEETLQKLFTYLDKHNIGLFFCNGGNNSQCITRDMQEAADQMGYPLQCIGIPKTIDNDIYHTDTCPGYGSVAKYTATSVYEMSLDLAAMCHGSTQLLIYESMGRSSGWIAAAAMLAKQGERSAPHLILVPEATFSIQQVITRIQETISLYGHCVVVLAEGADDTDRILSANQSKYTYKSIYLNQLIKSQLNIRSHVVIPDYLQRSARHLGSKTDVEQTIALSQYAYQLGIEGQSRIMVTIKRDSNSPYVWSTSMVTLDKIAGKERCLPQYFIHEDQLQMTPQCLEYLKPLIFGEDYPVYNQGIPAYSHLIYSNTKENKENL